MTHGLLSLMMSLFPFWIRTVYRTYIFNGGTENSRILKLKYLKLCSEDELTGLERHEGESLMT